MKERQDFIDEMLYNIRTTDQDAVSDWFFENTKETSHQTKIFGNIYDTLYSIPIANISENILEEILYIFADDGDIHERTKHQIIQSIPETQQIIDGLIIKTPAIDGQQTLSKFNTNTQLLQHIKGSHQSLLELFTNTEHRKEILINILKDKLKNHLDQKHFVQIADLITSSESIFDLKQQTIDIYDNNRIHLLIWWSIQKYIKPVTIHYIKDKHKEAAILSLNNFLIENKFPCEVIDIELGKIIVKWDRKDQKNHDILLKKIESLISNKDPYIGGYIQSHNFCIQDNEEDDISIFERHLLHFLRDHKIDLGGMKGKIHSISFSKKTITVSAPDIAALKMIDDAIFENNGSEKRNKFFESKWSLKFIPIGQSEADTKGNIKEGIKRMLPKTSVALPIDANHSFENVHNLNDMQKEYLIESLYKSGNIALIGPSGSGKTHIAHAIANQVKKDKNVIYTTGEKFCNEFWAIAQRAANKAKSEHNPKMVNEKTLFIDSFNNIDILILDGIEALSGSTRTNTQELFKRIINSKQIKLIFTSETPVADIIWTKKLNTKDGTSYSEDTDIFQEFRNTSTFTLKEIEKQDKEKILNEQWQSFITKQRSRSLFLSTELPNKVKQLLIERVNPNLYEKVFEAFYIGMPKNEQEYFVVLRNYVSQKATPEAREIISTIVEQFMDLSEIQKIFDVSKFQISSDTYSIGRDKKEAQNRVVSASKNSLEHDILSLCVFFIKSYFPKKKFGDIGAYFNHRKDISTLHKQGEEILQNNPQIGKMLASKITSFLQNKYSSFSE